MRLVAAGIMVSAMADTMVLGDRLLPAWAWAVLLLTCAAMFAVAGRECRRSRDKIAHHAVMGAMVGVMAWQGRGGSMSGMSGMSEMSGAATGGSSVPLQALVLAITLCYAAWILFRPAAPGDRTGRAVGLGSVLVMAAMVWAA